MGTTLKISIAETSAIVRSGMMFILKHLDLPSVKVTEIDDTSQITAIVSSSGADILIVNPALLGPVTLQHIKNKSGCKNLMCVALQLSLTDTSVLKTYNESISLYDTPEQIKDKLHNLIKNRDIAEPQSEMLSNREKEIIVCVVKGMTNKQIADSLFLSTHTVMTHRRNIASKLQIHSPAGLTIYAIVNKLVDLADIKDTITDLS